MEERKGFGSTFGFLMAAVGSAVGLGNIWGFPNKMGENGGALFLIIYLVLAVFCGVIIMWGELALGRKTGKGAIASYQIVSKKFKWLGWLATISPFLILCFYCALGGYCLKYVVLNVGNLFGAGFGSAGQDGGTIFGNFLTNPVEGVIYGIIFVMITVLIVMGGVGGGIEKVCSVGMPALFVILIICIIRSCTLPGAIDGLKYMFVPGWAVANGILEESPSIFSVLATAGGQMFFSLSLGMGVMITYGSYLDKEQNLQSNAILIVVMDTLVALFAGMCVLPARFALDPNGPIGGPKLLFVTMQNVFDNMGGVIGAIFGILFYGLVVFAAISSSISLLEVLVAHFVDKAAAAGKGDKRKSYSLIVAIPVALLCILMCVDGLGSNGVWVPFQSFTIGAWNDCWLDFFDVLAEGILMPLGALLMSIMYGWEIGPDLVKEEIEVNGTHKFGANGFFKVCIRYITPLLMLLVLYGQIHDFFLV
ncbi:MAG: sodium-dependent transporter [Clostridiales bacterium]|nr:sodium-dependent transporter [Candidatus Cacconaster stercorequi]